MNFAVAVVIAEHPNFDGNVRLRNGTATLIDFGRNKIAVTCAHVIEDYRKRNTSNAIFQIGNVKLNPLSQLVAEDRAVDLATICLSETQADALTMDRSAGAHFFQPVSWPPTRVEQNDCIALGGYPGEWREHAKLDELHFNGYGIGATAVTTVGDTHFTCQFERRRWVSSPRSDEFDDLTEFGGMSGGPAFVLGPLHWQLVGFIYEFSSEYDIMFLRQAHMVQASGSICAL